MTKHDFDGRNICENSSDGLTNNCGMVLMEGLLPPVARGCFGGSDCRKDADLEPGEESPMQQNQGGEASKQKQSERKVDAGENAALNLPSGKGLLVGATNEKGVPLGVDGLPLFEGPARRLNAEGMPVEVKFEVDVLFAFQLAMRGIKPGEAIKPETHKRLQEAIKSADALDRGVLATRIALLQTRLDQLQTAAKWMTEKTRVDSETQSLSKTFDALWIKPQSEMRDEQIKISKLAIDALCNDVGFSGLASDNERQRKIAERLESWLADAKNAAHKNALEAYPGWGELKKTFLAFVSKTAESNDLMEQCTKDVQLKKDIGERLAIMIDLNQLERFYKSSLSLRIRYWDLLSEQESVKKFQSLSADQKAASPLKEDVCVTIGQQLLREVAQQDKRIEANKDFKALAAQMGVSFEAVVTGPVDASTNAASPAISFEQIQATANATRALSQWLILSEEGKKPLAAASWKIIDDQFKEALKSAQSVPKEVFDALSSEANASYENFLRAALAKEKSVSPDMISVDEILRRKDALRIEGVQAGEKLVQVLANLPPEKRAKLDMIQLEFQQNRAKELAKIQADLDAALTSVSDPLRQKEVITQHEQRLASREQELEQAAKANQKTISPELKASMDALESFQLKAEGLATLKHNAEMAKIQDLRNAPEVIKAMYARALAGQNDLASASKELKEALTNSQVAALLDRREEFRALAEKLDIETPSLKEAREKIAFLFPEEKKVAKAVAILKDKTKNPREAMDEASKLFEEALRDTDRSSRKIEEHFAAIAQLRIELAKGEEKNPNLPPDQKKIDDLQTLIRQAGNIVETRFSYAVALNEFGHRHNDAAAKEKSLVILKSIQDVAGARFVPADLHHVGILYEKCPEILTALKQCSEGKQIDIGSGAVAQFMAGTAFDIIKAPSIADQFVLPGISVAARETFGTGVIFGNASQDTEQKRAVALLADAYLRDRAATDAKVNQESEAGASGWSNLKSDLAAILGGFSARAPLSRLSGPVGRTAGFVLPFVAAGETRSLVDTGSLTWNPGDTSFLRGAGAYGLALGTNRIMKGNQASATLNKAHLETLSARFGIPVEKLGTNVQTVRSALSGEASRLRALSTVEAQSMPAARAVLQKYNLDVRALEAAAQSRAVGLTSAEAQLSSKLTAQGATAAELQQVETALTESALRSAQVFRLGQIEGAVRTGGLSFGSYLNPANILIPRSGNSLIASYEAGAINYSQLGARAFWNRNLYGTAIPAFAFESGRKGLHIFTGETQPDGQPYDLQTHDGRMRALKASTGAGLETAVAATVMVPIAAGLFRAGGGALGSVGASLVETAPGIRTFGRGLVERGSTMAANSGTLGILGGRSMQAMGFTAKVASVPAEALKVPGYALMAVPAGSTLAGGLLRRTGVDNTVRNLGVVGIQPGLSSFENYVHGRRLADAAGIARELAERHKQEIERAKQEKAPEKR